MRISKKRFFLILDAGNLTPQQSTAFDLVPSARLRLPIVIVFNDSFALEKACDSIVFLVRDPAHITPNNIEVSVTVRNTQ